ncbi:MAG: hypothetical protein AVDCRST_MAG70-481 [uncultured Thermomicrobiales bacterium]|uniref:Uncharacterized protein n=1 Tax=uncultured Thermomicrobiales bacterium TaxID=1645740 RepID=A0A6J4UAP3_9BACT|nr:MAG: hypothetical protein AVDCRST_MAG70-481 [uncultured Thermomicrobiales bacterium]
MVRTAIAVSLALAIPFGGVSTVCHLDDQVRLRKELERGITWSMPPDPPLRPAGSARSGPA